MSESVVEVHAFDFGKHKAAMVDRFGHSEMIRDAGFSHLTAILADAQRADDGTYYALPHAADQAMHVLLLDNVFCFKMGQALFGKGRMIAHDPFPPDGPAREVAWQNTQQALAKIGVSMPDYQDAPKSDGVTPFGSEGCWLWIERLAA
ncbi:hypothetical protein [Azospirillum griseum]|uniref:Uncharacterized protein n=1 Tax=Azospirillum griseum TaxID=2496639 RepID=A0A431VN75_9PROT|nr:hypothetical protein [Azospirillum griseum]RTR24221.1 hypothetical protein EJ903_00055 [Azospirillum griseum]